jgi:hypothetical protein
MSILVRPTIPRKSSSRKRLARFDEARLLIDLANMRDDGARNFRKTWDSLYRRYSDRSLVARRDELQLLWNAAAPLDESEWRDQQANPTLEEVCSGMTEYKKRYFKNWHDFGGGDSLEQMICQEWLSLEKSGLHVDWTPTMKGIRPDAGSLPAVLAWACLMHAEHLGVCRSPECVNRYFIASRNDQRYCSPECAWPAKKAAKLKWWRTHRGKKVQARKVTVKARPMKGEAK